MYYPIIVYSVSNHDKNAFVDIDSYTGTNFSRNRYFIPNWTTLGTHFPSENSNSLYDQTVPLPVAKRGFHAKHGIPHAKYYAGSCKMI